MLLIATLAVFGAVLNTRSANYYVDFSAGSDTNPGTSTNTAWKHCPGDNGITNYFPLVAINAGDTVIFKGGVSYNETITTTLNINLAAQDFNGTSNNPITYQGSSGWGTGKAIMEGTVGTVTNSHAFDVRGQYIMVTGFEIRDYAWTGILDSYDNGSYLTISNCYIHHNGVFPDTGNYNNGSAFLLNSSLYDVTVVSNIFSDCIQSAFSTGCSNLIVWGNEISHMCGHGSQPSGLQGYFLCAYNYFHDNTNGNPLYSPHCDAAQITVGTTICTLIVCNNRSTDQVDDFRFQFDNGANGNTVYVFNNVCWSTVIGQSTSFGGTCPSINFAAIWCFNNTFVNMEQSGYGAVAWSSCSNIYTNVFELNNLFYFSRNNPQPLAYQYILDGFNLYTNSPGQGYLPPLSGTTTITLDVYQSEWPTNEIGSVTNAVLFVNYSNANFQLAAGSGGIGQGTNMSTMLPASTFNYLPAAYRVDPTKDIDGNQRGVKWDIGAYQYSTNGITPVRPLPPTGLIIIDYYYY